MFNTLLQFIASFGIIGLRAGVLSKLWFWYVIPFFGLAPLNFGFALGFSLLFYHLKGVDVYTLNSSYQKYKDKYKKSEEEIWHGFMQVIAFHLCVLLFGWLGTFFL